MRVRTSTGGAAEAVTGSADDDIDTAAHALISDGVLHGGTISRGRVRLQRQHLTSFRAHLAINDADAHD